MKKVVSEIEILDFAEGLPLDQKTEEAMISVFSASLELRQDIDRYRRDLASADAGIPEVALTLDVARELPVLAKKILKARHQEVFSMRKYMMSRELLVVVGFLLAMILLVGIYLWVWNQKN